MKKRLLTLVPLFLIIAMLVAPIAADETIYDGTVILVPWELRDVVKFEAEEGDTFLFSIDVLEGDTSVLLMDLSAWNRILANPDIEYSEVIDDCEWYRVRLPYGESFEKEWEAEEAGFYVFALKALLDGAEVQVSIVKETGFCLGTLLIIVIPVVGAFCILGKRHRFT